DDAGDVVPEVDQHRGLGAQLDDRGEGGPGLLAGPQQLSRDAHVGTGGDRQELGEGLDQAQDDGADEGHGLSTGRRARSAQDGRRTGALGPPDQDTVRGARRWPGRRVGRGGEDDVQVCCRLTGAGQRPPESSSSSSTSSSSYSSSSSKSSRSSRSSKPSSSSSPSSSKTMRGVAMSNASHIQSSYASH